MDAEQQGFINLLLTIIRAMNFTIFGVCEISSYFTESWILCMKEQPMAVNIARIWKTMLLFLSRQVFISWENS